ncbi:MAG: rhomboid family intramembrane serine protease [Vicinamibacteria bacterium]|nr:rhomboid family intramembrane serine protease [Vicinamibacteria bacterium]
MILLLPLRAAEWSRRSVLAMLSLMAVNLLVFLFSSPDAARKLAEQEAKLERVAEWSLRLPRKENARLNERIKRFPSVLAFLEQDQEWPVEIESLEIRERLTLCIEDYRTMKKTHSLYRHGFVPAEIGVRRLILHQFLHADIVHLAFNMLFLWAVGALVELTLGPFGFLAAYLMSGMAAALAHAALNPLSMEPAIGASGAVSGMMGLVAVMHGRRRLRMVLVVMLAVAPRVYFFSLPAYVFIALWLLEQIFFASFGNTTLDVAFGAHLGGFAFGVIVAIAHRFVFGPPDIDLDSEE